MTRTARLGRFCGLIVLTSYALLGQEDPSIAGIERDGAQLAEQLQRVYTVATNRSMAPDKFSARVAAVAELSVLTNTSTAKLSIPESTEEPPRRPAPRWVAGFDKKFVAENSFVRASVADDVSELGALKVTLPTQAGSREVRSSIVGLAFCEPGENGRTVLIAQVKPTKAQLLADERIITFRNAFSGEGVMADLVYELTDASLAQDVVIRGRLPEPERLGLSADSYLVMVTEFHDAPPPKQWAARKGEFDRTLQWGTAGIVRGKAFSLGEGARSTVDVQKMWVEQDGRTLLYETVPYPWIKEAVNALPATEDSSATEAMPLNVSEGDEQGGVESRGSAGNLLSALPKPILPTFDPHRPAPPAKPMAEVAALGGPGFVLDFTLVDYQVISVDFGADHDEKRGFGAIGRTSFDYWNVYDVENAARTNRWFKDGMSLLYTDQSVSGASVKVENAPGAWSSKNWMQSLDPAYDDYIYPIKGEAKITISSLPAGSYDFYLFGHGPAENANTVFTLGTNTQSTAASGPTWTQPNWREGQHYVMFRAVEVQERVPVTITASAGESGYAVINALQIGRTGQLMPPPEIQDFPETKRIPQGGAVLLSVAASGCGPLSYQWFKDGQPLPSATNATHHVLGADTTDQGAYTVQVSGVGGEALSPELMLLLDGGGCVSVPSGIVGWWPGQNSADDAALDHDGFWGGTPSYETGVVGLGFGLGSGRYVAVPYAPDLDVGASSGLGFTIEGWVKRYDNAASPLFQWGSGSQSGVHVWANFENVGMVYANILEVNGRGHGIRAADALPLNGPFAHVALTYTASSDDIKLYVNGALKTTVNEGVLGSLKTGLNFNLGYRPADGLRFNGVIDEASLYNRPLSPQEIYNIYTAGGSGKCPPPSGTAPVITTQPQSQAAGLGNSVTFSVVASGTPPLSYQWQRNGQNIGTGPSYYIPAVEGSQAGNYRVIVDNAYGSATSSEATLTVTTTGTPLPYDCIAWWKGEGNANDSVGTSHASLHNYADYESPSKVGQAFKFPGPTSYASVPDSELWSFGSGNFTIEFWVRFNSWQASGSYYQPEVIFMGHDEGGGTRKKWLFALGNGLLNFHATDPSYYYSGFYILSPFAPELSRWYHLALVRSGNYVSIYKDGVVQGSAYFPYPLANPSAPLTIGQAESLGYIKGCMDEVTIYNRDLSASDINGIYGAGAGGKVTAPVIASQPLSVVVNQGSSASFSVTATGATGYQWYKAGNSISGATGGSYTIPSAQGSSAGVYHVVASNSGGSVTSSPAVVAVITTQPQSQTVAQSQNASFSAGVSYPSGYSPAYQWLLNGATITGAGSSSYTRQNIRLVDAGTYAVRVTVAGAIGTSAGALLTVPVDYDADGLADQAELDLYHTSPIDSDTDDDGIRDGAEVNTYHTDPLVPQPPLKVNVLQPRPNTNIP